MQTTLSHTEIEQLAHKRAAAKMGWIIHALVYVAVNTGLALVAAASGRHWAVFPALGWGLGLLIHGLVVWAAVPGSALQRIRACMPELARHGNKVAAFSALIALVLWLARSD